MASDYISHLPNEVILEIFSYLDMTDLALCVQYVGDQWKELSQDKTLWKNIVFNPDDQMLDDERVHLLKNMPALKSYKSTRGRDTKLIIDTLCTFCKDIRHLHLNASHRLEYPLLELISNTFPYIEKLIIPFLKEDNQLQYSEMISKLPNLATLGFTDRYATVPDGILKPLADGCPALQHLDLGDSTFKDEDIRYFLLKKKNRLLSFCVTSYMSRQTYMLVIECKNLEHFYFNTVYYTSDLSYEDVSLLKKLTNLKSLKLVGFNEVMSKAIPNIFQKHSLPDIVEVYIAAQVFNGKDLETVLKNCPQLVQLSICGTDLEEGFQYIENCKKLEYLSLQGCPLTTQKCIDFVASGCPKLKHLDLSCSPETTKDDLFLSVFKCKNLNVINISYSYFKGTHFHLIPKNLVHLRELVIYECGMGDELWDSLLKEMPNLKLTGRYCYDDD